MENEKVSGSESTLVHWHPAFLQAMQHELYVPIQIIESKKLPEHENLWLSSLTKKDLRGGVINDIVEIDKQRKAEMPLDVYLAVLSRVNPKAFEEAYYMATKTKKREETFEEFCAKVGLIPKWMARGEVKGKAEGKIEGKAEERKYCLDLLNQGISVEELKLRLSEPVVSI